MVCGQTCVHIAKVKKLLKKKVHLKYITFLKPFMFPFVLDAFQLVSFTPHSWHPGGLWLIQYNPLQINVYSHTAKPTTTAAVLQIPVMTTSFSSHLGHHNYHKILLINFVVLNRRVILQDFTSIYQLLPRYWEVVFPPLCFDLLLQGLYLKGSVMEIIDMGAYTKI